MLEDLRIDKFYKDNIIKAVNILQDYGCKNIFLFGSMATGSVHIGSDLDIAVEGLAPRDFFGAMGKLLIELDINVDLIDLDDKDDRFVSVLRERGELYHVT